MDPATTATLWASLGAALAALCWALVRRIRRARRIMPRGRFRFTLSLRTPETVPPEQRAGRRTFRLWREVETSDPPIDVEPSELEREREPFSDRPSRPTPDPKRDRGRQ